MDKQNTDERTLRIEMSLQGIENRFGIGKDVIRALGNPSHVSFKVSDAYDSISVFPCDEDDVMSFKVPEKLFTDKRCVMRINSKKFVHGLMQANDLDITRTYTLPGKILEDINTAVFSLTDGIIQFSRLRQSCSPDHRVLRDSEVNT